MTMNANYRGLSDGARLTLSKEADDRRHFEGLARVLQSTDRILSGRDVEVRLSRSQDRGTYLDGAGAWTNGEDIWLNEQVLFKARESSDTIEEMVAGIKGLNYHELAHILFTPRLKGQLATAVQGLGSTTEKEKYWWCFNALEDQKAEMLFGKRYRLAYNYFKHTNLDFIINAENQNFSNLLTLEHGRLFLPKELRTKLFKLYANEYGLAAANEIATVIEQYIVLNTGTSVGRTEALRLIQRFFDALPKDEKDPDNKNQPDAVPVQVDSGHFAPPSSSGRFPQESDINSDEEEWSPEEELDGLGDDFADDSTEEDSEMRDGDGGDGEGDEEDGEESSAPSITNKSPVQGDKKLSAEEKRAIEGLKEDAGHAQADQLKDSSFAADLDRTAKAFGGQQAGETSTKNMGSFLEVPITSSMRSHQPVVLNTLRKLRLDIEPMWHTKQESGSVNATRAMLSDQTMELDVFDIWDEGSEEAGGIEVVLLMDLSSSMWAGNGATGLTYFDHSAKQDVALGNSTPPDESPIVAASQAIWLLKRTLDDMDVPVTVLGYNTQWWMLYTDSERASLTDYRLFDASGGTDPSGGVQEAATILRRSQKQNKILVSVTDGQWGGSEVYAGRELVDIKELVYSMRDQGVTTVLFGIARAVSQYGNHGHEIAMDVEEVTDIADIVEGMVKRIMLKAAHNHADFG